MPNLEILYIYIYYVNERWFGNIYLKDQGKFEQRESEWSMGRELRWAYMARIAGMLMLHQSSLPSCQVWSGFAEVALDRAETTSYGQAAYCTKLA